MDQFFYVAESGGDCAVSHWDTEQLSRLEIVERILHIVDGVEKKEDGHFVVVGVFDRSWEFSSPNLLDGFSIHWVIVRYRSHNVEADCRNFLYHFPEAFLDNGCCQGLTGYILTTSRKVPLTEEIMKQSTVFATSEFSVRPTTVPCDLQYSIRWAT